MNKGLFAAGVIGLAGFVAPAEAKPKYLDEVRATLVSKAARCTTCHTADDGAALNAYGDVLGTMGKERPLGDRVLENAAMRPAGQAEDGTPTWPREADVDEDGALNWVEVLAGTGPSDKSAAPDAATTQRISMTVVRCNICHEQVGIPGKRGLEANPHNELGKLLLKTFKSEKGQPRPTGAKEISEAAMKTPILARLTLAKTRKPKGSEASYWEKLRLGHLPADTQDNPTSEEVEQFKAFAKQQKKKDTRDATVGLDCDAHRAAGFLADAEDLP
jgi:hypothetical protein